MSRGHQFGLPPLILLAPAAAPTAALEKAETLMGPICERL